MSISIAEYKKLTAKKTTGNKKVKNATKSVVDGVSFDSNLEKTMYGLLNGAGITFEFQKVYVLQESFKYGKSKIRPITLTVDFYLTELNIIIDTKGLQTQQGALRYKMLKYWLHNENMDYIKIEMPKNKTECNQLLNKILYAPDLNQ